MSKSVSYLVYCILLLLIPAEAIAQNLSLGLKFLDSSHQYRVEDPNRALVAELVFPSKSLVGVVSYTQKVSTGKFSYTFEHLIKNRNTTGTDTDWFQENISVFSQSSTELEQYYGLSLAYEHGLSDFLNVNVSLFHRYWKLNWSDTKQYDYINDIYSEYASKTVRFTQTFNGLSLGLSYKDKLLNLPVCIFVAGKVVKHDSLDEHLARNFYTRSEDWLYGYATGASVEVLNNEYGALDISAKYEVVSGDSSMDFYNSGHTKYLSLPASFETIQKSMKITYTFSL